MDDDLPSLASGTVSSRFVTANEVDLARTRREEQWKAAYARLGQEPPPRPAEDIYDGRSLAEKLAANKAAKQEEWEERTKLANQFRALEEDEVRFLDLIRAEQFDKETKRKEEDAKELEVFQRAVAARSAQPDKPPIEGLSSSQPSSNKDKRSQASLQKKKKKSLLQGVVIRPKPGNGRTASVVQDAVKQSNVDPDVKEQLNDQGSSKRGHEGGTWTAAQNKRPRF